ncbi:acetate/propionate family kinase [Methyloversatilis thermotolerans]|uniref:acetate/propionate family kinase n=1 Tax=Methyloversatilis thermotolerans TaxID=1346290 RepID=UPI00035C80B0|nr:acetate/propionate family kinase [Methyloversatilis thermotolerans]
MAILAVNAGSSSLKFSLHPLQGADIAAATLIGSIQGLEPGGAPFMRWREGGERGEQTLPGGGHGAALDALRRLIADRHPRDMQAVAHRVVHGGSRFREPVVVTDEVLTALSALDALAPLHQPHNVAGIRAFRSAFPDTPQVACFDTAFHATVSDTASRFALPRALHDEGIRRYGFHGLSYEYIMSCLLGASRRARGRVLMAHLGNGASLCAAVDGRSQATTMGFSALDGLMMGTRSGALDAGVLLYLMQRGWDHDRLQTLLYRESGLLGVSGLSADMRTLRAADRPEAREAIALFTHRIVHDAGAMAACIGGLDAIAFSGGIGEHDVVLRTDVCAALSWMGVRIDAQRNEAANGSAMMRIDDPASGIEVWVVPTDEGRVAARCAARLLSGAPA